MRVGDGSSFASGDEEIRVGIDLVSVAEIQASITRFGARYSERVFTDHERASAKGDDRTFASSLAARFAAKEVLGCGPSSRQLTLEASSSVYRRP